MTLPTSDVDPAPDTGRGRQQATLGIGLVVAAAVGLTAFESIAQRQFVFTGIARMVLIFLLGVLVFRGRGWAVWLFGVFGLAGALAGVIGLAGAHFSPVGMMLFAPVIGANLVGVALLFLSPAARAFLKQQQALASRATPPASPARLPNGG